MKPGVYERKNEIDSIAAVIQLIVNYYSEIQDSSIFDDHFDLAMEKISIYIE
jgi:meiotically up-regulated gene 157 (Mug157) protein